MKNKLFSLLCLLCLFFSLGAQALTYPEITAKAAIVIEPTTGEVLYEKNADIKMYPASTTKIMTAVLALEKGNLDDKVTISEAAVEGLFEQGSSVNFKVGEELTLRQLLEAMVVASCNDAANAIAEHIGGTRSSFVDMMNERAIELGCTGTHFANPHGLHDENHYTTARDLSLIATHAMGLPLFAELAATQQITLPPTNKSESERKFYSTNHLISRYKNANYFYNKAIGIKTGSTTPAGYCLVAGAKDGDELRYSVILGASEQFELDGSKNIMSFVESKKLLEWSFANYSMKPIVSESDPVQEIPVELAQNNDYVVLVPQYSVLRLIPNDLNPEDITRQITVEEKVSAPITKGQVLGKLVLSHEDHVYGEVPLVASSDVAQSKVLFWLDRISSFFNGTLFKVILAVVCILIVVLIVYIYILRRGRRNRRRRQYRRYKNTRRRNY